jgi:hypothetical protein
MGRLAALHKVLRAIPSVPLHSLHAGAAAALPSRLPLIATHEERRAQLRIFSKDCRKALPPARASSTPDRHPRVFQHIKLARRSNGSSHECPNGHIRELLSRVCREDALIAPLPGASDHPSQLSPRNGLDRATQWRSKSSVIKVVRALVRLSRLASRRRGNAPWRRAHRANPCPGRS